MQSLSITKFKDSAQAITLDFREIIFIALVKHIAKPTHGALPSIYCNGPDKTKSLFKTIFITNTGLESEKSSDYFISGLGLRRFWVVIFAHF